MTNVRMALAQLLGGCRTLLRETARQDRRSSENVSYLHVAEIELPERLRLRNGFLSVGRALECLQPTITA
jgi:hypothetical protein